MKLGTSADGRPLTYDASLYEFRLSKKPVSYDDVYALERRNWVRWRAPELREWFMRIDRAALEACNAAARERAAAKRAAELQLLYRSTDPAVAIVDARGRVTVCGEGTADIIAARPNDAEFASPVRLVTIVSGVGEGAWEVRESFKSKAGKLAKKKSFRLPDLPEGARGYEKTGGSTWLEVSASGKVTLGKGAPRGLHTAEVAVRGPADVPSIVVSVEVR